MSKNIFFSFIFSSMPGSRAMSDLDSLYAEVRNPNMNAQRQEVSEAGVSIPNFYSPNPEVYLPSGVSLVSGPVATTSTRHPSAFGSWVQDPNIVSASRPRH